jgi:hypothetical protein
LVFVRAAVVVVATLDVSVVDRLVVVVCEVGAGVASDVAREAGALGANGAAAFCTCVAANAVMPPSDDSVMAVANPRRIALERISGEVFEGARFGMRSGEHVGRRRR